MSWHAGATGYNWSLLPMQTAACALLGIVSYSSRIIAAWRAIESEQQRGALFRDPMALALAGPRAMDQAHNRLKVRLLHVHLARASPVVEPNWRSSASCLRPLQITSQDIARAGERRLKMRMVGWTHQPLQGEEPTAWVTEATVTRLEFKGARGSKLHHHKFSVGCCLQ